MIRAVIVDDEVNAISTLENLIKIHKNTVSIVGVATSVDEAVKVISAEKPELLFLDIEMPNENGFNLLERVENHSFSVIFTTAYNEYAIKAIRFSALDYLLKPINTLELNDAIERVLKEKTASNKLLLELKNNLSTPQPTTLAIKDKDEVQIVQINTIIRFESDRNYTWIYFNNGHKKLIVKTLAHFEELLIDRNFIRTHKSHLVNSSHIVKINKSKEYTVLMTDNSIIPIAFRRRNAVIKDLGKTG